MSAQRCVLSRSLASSHTLVGYIVRLTIEMTGDRDRVQPLSTGLPWRLSGHRALTSCL
jgi:hypothetical protein